MSCASGWRSLRARALACAVAVGTLALATANLPGQQFPIGVWLQSPHNAKRYQDIGINLYVGLYNGPTKAQLAALDKVGMRTICHQNDVGLAHEGNTIVAWMHGDEPDNAQGRRFRNYKPPIPPWQVVREFEAMKQRDERPVLLNLGQGAAWDGWHGRGHRNGHPEDYVEYAKGCDWVSFDIYPVTHPHRDVKGKLEFVGRGVQRLRRWTRQQKPVWACIETSHVHDARNRPTPDQVRKEVWQAIACGADGIVYFAHAFAPKFVEAGLLRHDDVREAVARINAEIQSQAAVLRSPQLRDAVQVACEPANSVVARAHRHDGTLHLFVASMSGVARKARIRCTSVATGTVHGDESGRAVRSRPLQEGAFSIELQPYGVAHYRVAAAR